MANAPDMRLYTPAMSSWSRLIRSSDSAGTTLKRLDCASARSVWMPGRSRLAPEMAWSE